MNENENEHDNTWLEQLATVHRLLHVEDNIADAALAEGVLTDNGIDHYRIENVQRLAAAKARLSDEGAPGIDVILLDLALPDSQGLATLQAILELNAGIPVVVLTVLEDEHLGRDAVSAGAEDYLSKSELVTQNLLSRTLRYAIERSRRRRAQARLSDVPVIAEQDAVRAAIKRDALDARVIPLRTAAPALFEQLAKDYQVLLINVIGTSAGFESDALGDGANAILDRLVEQRGSPADLIDLHAVALHRAIAGESDSAAAIRERSRTLVLTMMARLAILYRDRA
ncbi:response regulator [Thiocystis violacea]|uniref:response regulator n=1 Tax=Thiocystis violacea TaxID=13725 RepID=UPI00190863E9|nr:response regulator [Thiocystis violacea]MBK1724628.1 hypothetical protein [Thiocystis violacea]